MSIKSVKSVYSSSQQCLFEILYGKIYRFDLLGIILSFPGVNSDSVMLPLDCELVEQMLYL